MEGFKHPFDRNLDPNNRSVKLAEALHWDELVEIYIEGMCRDNGRPTIDPEPTGTGQVARLAVAALIIKHKMKLSDEEVVTMIQENIYVQYFMGFPAFTTQLAFDPSLFVTLRRRMGADKCDRMSQAIIRAAQNKHTLAKDRRDGNDPNTGGVKARGKKKASRKIGKQLQQGKLNLDATVAYQRIVYPTDLKLIARSQKTAQG